MKSNFNIAPDPTLSQEDRMSPVKNTAAPRVDGDKLKLVRVESREAFAELKNEWDDLLMNTQTPSPFQSWDYLDIWWDVYGDKGYDIQCYIARDTAGKLVAAVPLMISQKGAFPGARGKFRHLAFIGGVGELAGESLDLPALPAYREAVGLATADLILNSFQGLWDVLYFFLVPAQSVSTHTMMSRLADKGVTVRLANSCPSPIVPIKSSWEDYFKSRSSKFGRRIRYIFSYAKRRYSSKYFIAGKDIPVKQAYKELVRMANIRWESENKAFHTDEFIDFHWKLVTRWIDKGRLFFGLVEMDGETSGVTYNFVYDNKMWGYQAPWNPKFRSARAGNLLHIWTTENAFNLGLRELDTLPGDSGYKREWCTDAHTLNTYEAACPRSLGGTMFTVARKIDGILKQKSQTTQKS